MGNGHSVRASEDSTNIRDPSSLTRECKAQFDTIEQASITSCFAELATSLEDTSILSQNAFAKFLGLPDAVGARLFLSASYVASYPDTDSSPTTLTLDALFRVIAIMLGRTDGILTSSSRLLILFESFATLQQSEEPKAEGKLCNENRTARDSMKDTDGGRRPLCMRKADLKTLLQFLLSIQDKKDTEVVSDFVGRFNSDIGRAFSTTAEAIVNTISPADVVTYNQLSRFMEHSPSLLQGLAALYAHFLFPGGTKGSIKRAPRPYEQTSLLNDATSAQIDLFLPSELIFGKLDPLYRASHDGFSMGSFESKVLRYPGPTILILEGSAVKSDRRTVFGIFCNTPWKQSSKDTFGDASTILFQLQPVHRVIRSPRLQHQVWFSKASGIGIGCQPPSTHSRIHDFGSLSLVLDSSLEYADFRDEAGSEDLTRIAVREVEVWGLGGDREAQRKAWEWEENEAQRRRTVNVKDIQADYDLLEMAGLVGQNRSGGSV